MDQRFGVFLQFRVNRGGATSWSLLGSQKANRIRNHLVSWMFNQADWLPDRFRVGLLIDPMFNQHPVQHMVSSLQGRLRISVGTEPFG